MYHWLALELCVVLPVALIYKEGGRRDGWKDVRKESRNTQAAWGIVSGHWFRSPAADALCQVVEMQFEMQLRY